MKIMITFITLLFMLALSSGAFAETLEDRVRTLEETLKKQEQTIQGLRGLQETLKKQDQTIVEQRKLIEELKTEVKQVNASVSVKSSDTSRTAETGEIKQLSLIHISEPR